MRRQNFIPPEAFPYETPTGLTYDSGKYAKALDCARKLSEYYRWRAHSRQPGSPGEPLVGVGLATVVKGSGGRCRPSPTTPASSLSRRDISRSIPGSPPTARARDHICPDSGRCAGRDASGGPGVTQRYRDPARWWGDSGQPGSGRRWFGVIRRAARGPPETRPDRLPPARLPGSRYRLPGQAGIPSV